MEFGRTLPIPEIEKLAHQVAASPDSLLRLPLNPRHLGAGGETSLIQLLLTWGPSRPQPTLQFWKDGLAGASQDHKKLTERLHGIVAALVTDTFVDAAGIHIDRASLFPTLLSRVDELYGPSPERHMKGPVWATLCADDINRSAPHLLYSGQKTGDTVLRSRVEYNSVVDSILGKTFPSNNPTAARTGVQRFDRDDVSSIAAMLYEVFRNTEDHALLSIDGSRIRKSVRGIYAQNHAAAPAKLAEMVQGFEPLAEYCRQLPLQTSEHQPSELQQTNLLEISTFDAGAGFAETFLRRSIAVIPRDEELNAVQTCFRKSATSKGQPGFGQGLSRVLQLLKQKKGFLRLRTGRLSLFLDLNTTDWDGEGSNSPSLTVWEPDVQLAPMRGSVLTLLIPLRTRA